MFTLPIKQSPDRYVVSHLLIMGVYQGFRVFDGNNSAPNYVILAVKNTGAPKELNTMLT